jgi:hypothetical protein
VTLCRQGRPDTGGDTARGQAGGSNGIRKTESKEFLAKAQRTQSNGKWKTEDGKGRVMSKGSHVRPHDKKKFDRHFEKIRWKKKRNSKLETGNSGKSRQRKEIINDEF